MLILLIKGEKKQLLLKNFNFGSILHRIFDIRVFLHLKHLSMTQKHPTRNLQVGNTFTPLYKHSHKMKWNRNVSCFSLFFMHEDTAEYIHTSGKHDNQARQDSWCKKITWIILLKSTLRLWLLNFPCAYRVFYCVLL